jgi:D-tyrosyl-tRNA(Tyr) deacylase
MIAVVQRVTSSSVVVEGERVGSIGLGYTILLGVLKGDSEEDIDKSLQKILHLRIFADEAGKMNRSLLDVGGEMLIISQFTLGASIKKGRRPSFDKAAEPSQAEALYEQFIAEAKKHVNVQSGRFGAHMEVEIHNDGPVTIIVDSAEL